MPMAELIEPTNFAEWRDQITCYAAKAVAELAEVASECHQLAFGQRWGELTGKRARTFDDRGVHPFSEAWGKVWYVRAALPAPLRDQLTANGAELDLWPSRILRWAAELAEADFRKLILAGETSE